MNKLRGCSLFFHRPGLRPPPDKLRSRSASAVRLLSSCGARPAAAVRSLSSAALAWPRSFPWPGPRVYAFLRVPLESGASALLLCESEVSRPRPPFLRPSPSGPQRSAAECSVRETGPFRLCAPPTLCASQRILPLEPFRRPVPLSQIALRREASPLGRAP